MSRRAFTAEQRAAVADRRGSALLAANAGSGKTAVMVERFAEAVRIDGVPVRAVLALTFTEKAAGELRERLRRRFTELGETEHARAVDGAWIGTIHGFCARVLRSHPLAAGLDPNFEVLDEPAATRLAGQAYDAALEAWTARRGQAAIDLAAAYPADLQGMVLGAHAVLRSRGATRPALTVPPEVPVPDPAAAAAACAAAAAHLAAAGNGKRIAAALAALEAGAEVFGAKGAPPAAPSAAVIPPPHELEPATLPRGAKALGEEPCEAYREAFGAYRQACADHHARAAVILIGELLEAFAGTYAEHKAARAGLDFEDLELGVRDLFAREDAIRRRFSERFELLMVDEFQDTNRLQLDVLEAIERDNLFAVGDEFQSIYGFRGADVEIFRERRAALDADRVRTLRANFRSAEELLDVLDGAFAPVFGERFAPLVAGAGRPPADPDGELRLFELGPPPGDPPVELLLTDPSGWEGEHDPGLAGHDAPAGRRAEARLLAHRLREEGDAGRRPGEIVVLVRATGSLRLFEQALEEQGLPTYVVGGRGYWSGEQVRDGLAYLAALANPHDEAALYGVLSSPFCGVGADALVLLAEAGRAWGAGPWAALLAATGAARNGAAPGRNGSAPDDWLAALAPGDRERLETFAAIFAAERERAEREPVELLLERAVARTGYDLAILSRAGGERRMANLRKLMRLAREYERAEGRDLRGFIAYAVTQDLAQAREGEAPVESEGLDAVRLMTIHRAKGLEFGVVCVADLGRTAAPGHERLLIGRDGSVGLRLLALGGGATVKALAYEQIAAALDAEEAAEERRLLYVAMTRARERLILSGASDPGAWPAARPGGAPIDWIVPALLDAPTAALTAEAPDRTVERFWEARTARLRVRLNTPATLDAVLPRGALSPHGRAPAAAPGTALPAVPRVLPAPARARAAPQRLSYSSLQAYARCPYRFYLERVLRLPEDPVEHEPGAPGEDEAPEAAGSDRRLRGSIAHLLLERIDFDRPDPPASEAVAALGTELGAELGDAEVADIRAVVGAFADSPLRARVAAAPDVRREAPFAFALDDGGSGPLVVGVLDVLAAEADGTTLVVDYKTDRLEGAEPADVVDAGYATQRAVYALAALRAGAPRAEIAYCFLERPGEPVIASFGPADAPALADRVSELARGVLAEEYPVTERPHRDLCGDCPGRRALCSYDESMTLRDPADAGAGAPQEALGTRSGSGGPS